MEARPARAQGGKEPAREGGLIPGPPLGGTVSAKLPLTGKLLEIIEERAKARRSDCPFVFHRDGRRLWDFGKAWETAREASGLNGILIHNLRRCAARNLSRAGVPESVAMEITGHKTRSMYRCYRRWIKGT